MTDLRTFTFTLTEEHVGGATHGGISPPYRTCPIARCISAAGFTKPHVSVNSIRFNTDDGIRWIAEGVPSLVVDLIVAWDGSHGRDQVLDLIHDERDTFTIVAEPRAD